MKDGDRTLTVGTASQSIRITLTDTAARMLNDLPGTSTGSRLGDHRSLLTTIAVGQAAAGRLRKPVLLIDAADILDAIEHSGPQKPTDVIKAHRITR